MKNTKLFSLKIKKNLKKEIVKSIEIHINNYGIQNYKKKK